HAGRVLETGWGPDSPVDDTVLRRFVCTRAEAWEPAVTALGGRTVRPPDFVLTDFGRPAGLGNAVTLLRPLPPDPEPPAPSSTRSQVAAPGEGGLPAERLAAPHLQPRGAGSCSGPRRSTCARPHAPGGGLHRGSRIAARRRRGRPRRRTRDRRGLPLPGRAARSAVRRAPAHRGEPTSRSATWTGAR